MANNSTFPHLSQYERMARESQDEKIAQLLMEAEKRKIEEERLAMQKDMEFARRLQAEDARVDNTRRQPVKEEPDRSSVSQKKREQEQKDQELARALAAEDDRRAKALRDLEYARKVQEEEVKRKQAEDLKKKQEKDDEDLARLLQNQLTFQAPRPVYNYQPPSYSYNNNYNYNTNYYPAQDANNVVNGHTKQIHKQHCGCAKTNSWDSNHIFSIHTQYCACLAPYVGRLSNEGAIHQHSHKCCRKNHVHSIACHCDYRAHQHTHLCCAKYHVHNQYCNCVNK